MKILILTGSESDLVLAKESIKVLEEFGIPYRIEVASAHRSPERVIRIIKEAEKDGAEVIIAMAGMAAHLPGVVAAHTILPVIGVPVNSSPLNGIDALLSIAQMPGGIPVATVAIGKAGAKNAAILAAEILALKDQKLQKKIKAFREKMAEDIEKIDASSLIKAETK
ncbi:MAG: 5-(carboxyamino)imidazole ribonucleotide mutase [Thermodesulfovibrionales bacterium]|nr:5-(carboxyamino)imidazole ribonucleotide mutase [Thermodesulfovibrionales bacterium]